jgi:hypothetical protein
LAKFGEVYRWTGGDSFPLGREDGKGRTAMMIYPPGTQGALWSGIDLIEWGDVFGGHPGAIADTFSPALGSDANNWEPIECTLDQETATPRSGRSSRRSITSR